MTAYDTGRILVVPARVLDELGRFQGFCPDAKGYLTRFFEDGVAQFQPRQAMEDDPSYKQIIPYVIFRSGRRVFCYTRGKSQTEVRLHRLRSLGVGGHVDEADADGKTSQAAYEAALQRELDEEIELAAPGRIRLAGLINDDATAVGAVHLGVVHLYDLDAPAVTAREAGLADGSFLDLDEVGRLREHFETWSQICFDHLLRDG